ncbi:MAG: ferritin family protein [Armatimonadota bacterium]|nr:ferritin family protein [Armatimonadota bacterium]
MSQIADDARQVLEMALQNELKGREILEQAKENVENPLAKATFDFLAHEEDKHIAIIKQFASGLTGEQELDMAELTTLTTPEAKQRIRSIFERFRVAFEEVSATDQPRLEAYRVAMDMERAGHDFYKRAALQASDEKSRRLYEFLAGEEIKHFELIQDTHDFLQQPDALLAVEERWMQV